MKIGIVGLPNVGKSTLFSALTKKQVDTSNYPFATIDPNVGVVAVPDERLHPLADLSHSKKIIPASIEFVDIAGLVKGASAGEGLGNKFLSHIREVDAIVEVVRAFENKDIHHVSGTINPKDDMETINTELILADLGTVERAIPRIEKETRTGNKTAIKKLETLKELQTLLSEGHLANIYAPKTDEGKEILQELHLLTVKPFIFLFNGEDTEAPAVKDLPSLSLNIKMEEEISQLGDDAGDLKSMSGIDALIKKAYEVVGLITFLTTGEAETRAWAIPKNATAPRAGRAIHSDFEEKFIRADVISYENLLSAGSYAKARELGTLQTKGKDYIVQDGDVIEFKI
ncbi:MAG: redox-regulated ATPase YchF [Candidatus Ryanbacteria bacterium CG10_big_fil_rev_8_21_14_0_10_43_42]|uniref:Redox-regulated ATPase YchF n=1 Tax=Candidatus Ryanbacteria bacterium CG10_big_fil_rev_8_21_14_0_10_43_42 TaxID=1974864 RepID=A0A2M8KWQ8_9BACT|nr:MAG: redox-regulated ATPase YchF [Candidatus Ryanbacteria bacterium CG10_big_fil_rev_8_21_14_0_10_43_42]